MPETAECVGEAERRFARTVRHACLHEAKVQAFAFPLVAYPGGFCGGPVLGREEHRLFRHHRYGAPYDLFRENETYPHRLDGDYVYAGPVYDHFGHFMAEMVHRIIPAKLLGLRFPLLFVETRSDASLAAFDRFPSWLREVLGFCGVSEPDVVVLDRNAIVERLHLVPQAASLAAIPKPGYLDALRAYSTRRLDEVFADAERPRHVYVSRSRLTKIGSFLGESHLEAGLERAGLTLFRPEEHGVLEQMDHYRKAELIVFPGGSACHGAELLGRRMLGKVVLIPRAAFQAPHFLSVLKPRAIDYASADVSTYLGTLLREPDGSPSYHRGVAAFDLDETASLARDLGFCLPHRPSRLGYLRTAIADLRAYRAEVKGWQDRGGDHLARLFARLLKHVLFPGRARVPAPVRPRGLTDRQIARIWRASEATPGPFGPFWRLLLLTLQPHSLVAGMRWSEVSLERRAWTIPTERMKGAAARIVPLSQAVIPLFGDLPRDPGIDLVFHWRGKPLAGIGKAKDALDTRIGAQAGEAAWEPWSIGDLRLAGLRRLEDLGYDPHVARVLLGLAPPGEEGSDDPAEMLAAWDQELARMGRDDAETQSGTRRSSGASASCA